MRQLRVGVIGYGRLGQVHAHSLGTHLAAVYDSSQAALDDAGYDLATPNIERFLDRVDAVVVTSPTQEHLEHIRAAALAGKAIYTEKPVGLTLGDTEEVLAIVERAGVPFQIGFQRRWDKRYQQAKSLIEEGAIGQPVLLKAYGRDPNVSDRSKWGLDHNGGIFLNCAIHDYDTARWLLGEEPIKLQATADVLVHRDLYEVGDADHCATRLEFMDSAVALTEWSRFATYGYDIGLEVVGTDGAIKLNLTSNRPGLTLRRATSRTTSVFDVFCCAFEDSIKGFVAAVESGSETTPGIQDALASLRIALAARDSAHYDGEDVFL